MTSHRTTDLVRSDCDYGAQTDEREGTEGGDISSAPRRSLARDTLETQKRPEPATTPTGSFGFGERGPSAPSRAPWRKYLLPFGYQSRERKHLGVSALL